MRKVLSLSLIVTAHHALRIEALPLAYHSSAEARRLIAKPDDHAFLRTPILPERSLLSLKHNPELSVGSSSPTKASSTPDNQQHLPSLMRKPLRLPSGSWAALGDSYAAGEGAGTELNATCARFSDSYPRLLAESFLTKYKWSNTRAEPGNDLESKTAHDLELHHLACAGARTGDIIKDQIDGLHNLQSPLAFATLSIGGNDAHFFPVIDACVFAFDAGVQNLDCTHQVLKAIASLEAEVYYRLERAYREILAVGMSTQSDFHPFRKKNLNSSSPLQQPLASTADAFRLFITGYARFFNADTPNCNHVSFEYWRPGQPSNPLLPQPQRLLTRARRLQINSLVLRLTHQIRRAVEQVNADLVQRGDRPRIVYVDIDQAFDGHRFCEPGVYVLDLIIFVDLSL